MRYLFIHQNFPGQFLHIVRHLLKQGGHDIVFISQQNPNQIEGVRKIAYRMPRNALPQAHPDAQEFELAMVRAETVARMATRVKQLGFTPDVVVGHHGWGELLNIQDVWPGVPVLGYLEFYYHVDGVDVGFDPEFPLDESGRSRVRAKNAVNLLALQLPAVGQSPTEWQRSTYPAWSRDRIALLEEGVDLTLCRPAPGLRRRPFLLNDFEVRPRDRLVTYVARDLEPYRGFHIAMRALPRILERRDTRVIMVGGDGVSYGARLANATWRERMMAEVGGAIDLGRVHFPGKVDYATYRRILQRSDAHIYLTYPFVASWSLREALSCGCALVASDTPPVREFVTDGENGLLTPCLDPALLADRVLQVLEDRDLSAGIRAGARAYAEAHLEMGAHLAAYEALIGRVMAGEA